MAEVTAMRRRHGLSDRGEVVTSDAVPRVCELAAEIIGRVAWGVGRRALIPSAALGTFEAGVAAHRGREARTAYLRTCSYV